MPKDPAAVKLGRKGGKSTSPAKQAAVRANVQKARDAKKLKFSQRLELDIFYAKLGKRPKCGRCQKFHTKKQLNICDDGIASGDQRDYPVNIERCALCNRPANHPSHIQSSADMLIPTKHLFELHIRAEKPSQKS